MNFSAKIFGFGLLLLGAIGLVGCRPQAAANSAETTTLTLSGWQSSPNEKQILEQVIRDFEAQNPGIKIKYEVINSEYMDVIRTRLIGDVAPDVFYLDALEAPMLIKYNVLEPLDSYITPEFNLADFEPALIKAFQREGKLYGLPKDFSTLALVYNKKAFLTAGVSQPPTTWGQLQTVAKKLTIDS